MAAENKKPNAKYTTTKKAKASADAVAMKIAKDFGVAPAKSKTPVKDKTADAARLRATERAYQLRGESAEDKKFRLLMEKYKYDITKIPGYKP
jgi:hypothetical protein